MTHSNLIPLIAALILTAPFPQMAQAGDIIGFPSIYWPAEDAVPTRDIVESPSPITTSKGTQ